MRTLVLTMVNSDGDDVFLGVFRSETQLNAWLMDEFAERDDDGRDVRPVWRGESTVRFDTCGEDWLRFWTCHRGLMFGYTTDTSDVG